EKWEMLDPDGTSFQKKIWQELLKVPFGKTVSYGELANAIGKPLAARAVGSAVGANPICLLIPCHRVLPASGRSGNYRWGPQIKRALLDAEQREGSSLQSLFE
ncbi:MAG: MGMT family protein, partial [Verrucomicrobiota bacterium]